MLGATIALRCFAQSDDLLEAVRVHHPHVAKQAQAELDRCLADKRCREADRLSLLTGVLLLAESSAAEAVKQLGSRPAPKRLEAFHAWYLGEAQAWAGAEALSVRSLARARKTAPAWLQKKIDLRVAELQLALGQPAKALPALEGADLSPEVLLDRALAYRALKATDKARAAFRQLLLRYPTHPHALTARRLAEGVGPWTHEENLARAQAQLAQGDASACLATLEEVTAEALAQRVALTKGQALLARGKDEEALAQLELASTGPSGPIAADAVMAMAKRLMRLGDSAGARKAFQRVDVTWPKDHEADEAGYLAAWLAMNMGELEVATSAFVTFESNHTSSKRRDEARWFRAFSELKLERFEAARETARSIAVDFPKSLLVPQALYWATRAAQLDPRKPGDAGVGLDVAREYAELVETFPGTLYARFAIERLHELGQTPTQPFTVAPRRLEVKPPLALALASELARAGLLRDAAEEVQTAVGAVTNAEQAMTFGHALQSMGEFAAAHALAARYLWGAVYTLRTPEAVALMYPRAWKDSVETASSAARVDPFFAWAIMRRESAFRPDVTSAADARGLMQIIPPTARQIAAETKSEAPSPDDLFAPDTNVRLATWYLAALFARLDHPGLVAAAYNGGPSAVVKWVRARGDEPFDEFVEEIPYKETRGYVKQVVADYYIYRALYGDGDIGTLSLVVPKPKSKGVDF